MDNFRTYCSLFGKKYLCICGTSVPSERIFSSAGHISNSLQNRLLPENISKLVFLANNMKDIQVQLVNFLVTVCIIVLWKLWNTYVMNTF